MPRPLYALIHHSALTHNLSRIRTAAGTSQVFAVVKADAYGHGIENVYPALRGADGFALLEISEAQRLRTLGYRGPILMLEGAFEPRDLEAFSQLQLWHVVHKPEQIDWLASHKTDQAHRVFLKLNAGMNRLGFKVSAYKSAYYRMAALAQVDEVGHMMHFASADALVQTGFELATQDFRELTDSLAGERSVANSAALLRGEGGGCPQVDWVRAGVALYGCSPDYPVHDIGSWDLQPTMSLRSQLIAIQEVEAGEGVGYGASFVAPQAMRVGIVACGYADGYPRHAPNHTPALVDGQRTGLIGRVSMDMLAVDLSHLPQAKLGSEVVLWGQASSGEILPIDEVAYAASTIGYELMCAVALRVRKIVQ